MSANKLTVKQAYIESEICYTGKSGRALLVVLKNATQDELKLLKELGDHDHIFEATEAKKEK